MGLISPSDITQHKITFAWPGARQPRAAMMYYSVTLRAVAGPVYKPKIPARAQSLVNAFPNLAGSDLPDALILTSSGLCGRLIMCCGESGDIFGAKKTRRSAKRLQGGNSTRKPSRMCMDQAPAKPASCLCPSLHTSSISMNPLLCVSGSEGWKRPFSLNCPPYGGMSPWHDRVLCSRSQNEPYLG